MGTRRSNGEGSVYKRSDGRWTAAYFDENMKRKYVYGKTQKEARQKLQEKMLETSFEKQEEYYLKDWIKIYLEAYKKNEIKATTYGFYMQLLRTYIEPSKLGSILLSRLKTKDLQNFYNEKIKEGYNSKSVRHMCVIINGALEQAVREKLIKENPNKYTVLDHKPSLFCFCHSPNACLISATLSSFSHVNNSTSRSITCPLSTNCFVTTSLVRPICP